MEDDKDKRPLLQTGAVDIDIDASRTATAVGSVNANAKKSSSQTAVNVNDGDDEEEACCDRFLPCDPRQWMHRYFMLAFMCMLSFGSYYVYDNPTALQRTIQNVMNVDTTHYTLLYSIYSWPNVILSIFGGFLLDRVFGIRIGTLVFSALICLGQFVFALGGIVNRFWVMVFGRFIFGLGGENLAVAQNTYAVLWFKGKELNMVFGLLLSISRLGSTVNMNINQRMFDNGFNFIDRKSERLGVVLLVGFGFCILSLLCAVFLGLFDKRAERLLKRKENGTGEQISLKDIKDFPLRLWLVFIICVSYYVTVFPFIGLATVFLMDKYQVTSGNANILNSLVYIISAVASPFLGLLVDKTGFNLFWLNLGTVATLGAHAMFAFLPNQSFISLIAMILMGVAYSMLACALWPLVAFIVPEYQLGTAYGIMQAVQNLGLAIVTIVSGLIVDKAGYLILEVFFMANLCIALITGILLYLMDSASGGNLNLSAWARARIEKAKEKEEEENKKAEEEAARIKNLVDSGTRAPYVSNVSPQSAFQIRNRYLSRMGAKIPDHVAQFDPLTASYAHIGFFR